MTEKLKFGHYEVVSELGRGGMGVVYRAVETSLNREVAIKALAATLANDPIVVERFLREAKSAAAIKHPNVIPVYFAGQEGNTPFFAMELVEGQPLSEMIRSADPFSARQAANIILQSARGLKAAHEKGLIHRDIKPANLMVTTDGTVKIADFGIASRDSVDKRLTNTGEFLGTPGYLSPEVCKAENVDQRSDIFSLGIVYFELLTGNVPFTDQSPLGMMLEVVEAKIPDVRLINPSLDMDTSRILHRMLAKDPVDRYQNCDELIRHLEDGFGRDAFSINAPAELQQSAATIVNKAVLDSSVSTMPYDAPDVFSRKSDQSKLPATLPSAKRSKGLPAWALVAGLLVSLGAGGTWLWSSMGSGDGFKNLGAKIQGVFLATADTDTDAATAEPVADDRMPRDARTGAGDDESTATATPEHSASPNVGGRVDEDSSGVGSSETAATAQAENEVKLATTMVEDGTVPQSSGQVADSMPVQAGSFDATDASVASDRPGSRLGSRVESRIAKVVERRSNADPVAASRHRLSHGKGRVLVLASGDPSLNSAMQQMLTRSLLSAGMNIVEADFVTGLPTPERRGSFSVANLSHKLLEQEVDVLLLIRLQYTGDEILTYYGQASRLLNVNVTADAYTLGDKRRLGNPWQHGLAYTELNREIKMAELAADIEHELFPAIRRVTHAH